MRKILFIEDTLSNKISYYLLVYFLIFLPFRIIYSELALAALGLVTLVNFKINRLPLLLNKHVIVMGSLYLLGLIGILYSPDIREALHVAERQLAILVFPIVLVLNGIDLAKYRSRLLMIFGLTCVATILYLYAAAFYTIHFGHLPLKNLFSIDFMNHNFSLPIQLHATYLSMFATLAVTVFLYLFQKADKLSLRIFYSICVIILLAGMIQLSSRAPSFAILFIINIVYPVFLLGKKKRVGVIIAAAILTAGTLFSIYNINSFKSRYVGELKNEFGMDTVNAEFTEPRAERWKAELELIKRSPLTGYGSGSEKKLLKQKFFEMKLYLPYALNFNSHSQYLSFLLNMGLLGLAGYLFVLGYGFLFAWKEKDFIFLGFMVIISVVSFSENILFLNKGIFFYSFFLSFFLLGRNPGTKGVT